MTQGPDKETPGGADAADDPVTLLIYLRSGLIARCDNVLAWEWNETRDGTSFTVRLKDRSPGHRLVMASLRLDQVDAVIEERAAP